MTKEKNCQMINFRILIYVFLSFFIDLFFLNYNPDPHRNKLLRFVLPRPQNSFCIHVKNPDV